MMFVIEAATKKIEHGLERNFFRRNTRQFRIFPIIPIRRRIPNIIVRHFCMRARVLIVDDMFMSIMSFKKLN